VRGIVRIREKEREK
jgi:hypothetical protein